MAERRGALPPDVGSVCFMNQAISADVPYPVVHPGAEPDAHGQAALLLAESMLHAFVEKSYLSVDEALSVIATTCDVKVEVAELTGETHGRMHESLDLLRRIADSLRTDAD